MTISITNQDPAPSAVNVSPFIRPRFSLSSDDPLAIVDLNTISVWVNGSPLIALGVPEPDSEVTPDGVGGFDLLLSPGELPNEAPVLIRVVADDTAVASLIDISWSFTVADARGPVLADIEPPPGSIATASPATVSLRVTDPGTGFNPATTLADMIGDPANMEYTHPELTGNHMQLPRQNFVGDGVSIGDTFDSAGAYTFGLEDIGRTIIFADREYKITAFINPDVRVNKQFTFNASLQDWSLLNLSLIGKEGRIIEMNSGVDIGERRRIVAVRGPELIEYDGIGLNGTAENVTIFHNRGLDVSIDGVLVVQSGFLDPTAAGAGWGVVVNVLGSGDIDVDVSVPFSWPVGKRVNVNVKAPDLNPDMVNVSDINYFFDVIDTRGPQIVNVSPAEGKRGLPLTTPSSDITFDITCSESVDLSTLNVEVNGVAAITAGVAVGDYSTSTITPGTDSISEQVVLKRATSYTDGEVAFVDINVDDSSARPGERRLLRFHFGAEVSDAAVNTGLGGTDVVRVIAYDLTETSFADPSRLNHNGFARDGYRYTNGNKGTQVASWFTELGAFPLSGHIVVTATNGWSIVKALDSAPWMTCVPQTSPAWSMADNDAGPLTDADFGPEAVLAISGNNVILVDFVEDRAERYNAAGKNLSFGDITSRNAGQSGFGFDTNFALPIGPYEKLAMVRVQAFGRRDTVMAIGTSGQLSVVRDVSDEFLSVIRARTAAPAVPPTVVTRASPGTWTRIRLGPFDFADELTAMLISYNDAGQGQVEVWDWFKFQLNQSNELFLDDMSTPAIAAAEVRDLEMSQLPDSFAVAVVMVGELDMIGYDIITPASSGVTVFSETTLGLNGVASAEMKAVALEPGLKPDFGHLYACVAAPADGRVTRFRIHSSAGPDRVTVVHSGQPFISLASIGETRHGEDIYVRTSMKIS
jgi:hypothetical protein